MQHKGTNRPHRVTTADTDMVAFQITLLTRRGQNTTPSFIMVHTRTLNRSFTRFRRQHSRHRGRGLPILSRRHHRFANAASIFLAITIDGSRVTVRPSTRPITVRCRTLRTTLRRHNIRHLNRNQFTHHKRPNRRGHHTTVTITHLTLYATSTNNQHRRIVQPKR